MRVRLLETRMKQVQLRMTLMDWRDLRRAAKAAGESLNRFAVKLLVAAVKGKEGSA